MREGERERARDSVFYFSATVSIGNTNIVTNTVCYRKYLFVIYSFTKLWLSACCMQTTVLSFL